MTTQVGKTIRLRGETYSRLQAAAEPFVTPDSVVQEVLTKAEQMDWLAEQIRKTDSGPESMAAVFLALQEAGYDGFDEAQI